MTSPTVKPLRIGVLASGNGSNLQAIIDHCAQGHIDGQVELVLSNNPQAYALQRATQAGVTARCIDHRDFDNRETYNRELIRQLKDARIELVVLAGYMRLLTDEFIDSFPHRILNIHPSLLPAFPGLNVQQQALEHGARVSGCTVHFVDKGLDTGPIIAQAVVPILPNDTVDSLSARILVQEHRIYPHVIQLFARGVLNIEGRRVHVHSAETDQTWAHINPPLPG